MRRQLSVTLPSLLCIEDRTSAKACACPDLSAAVDVYADWVDACDAVAKEHGEAQGGAGLASSRPVVAGGRIPRPGEDDEEDNIDDLIDDADVEDEGLGGYGGEGVVADDEEY